MNNGLPGYVCAVLFNLCHCGCWRVPTIRPSVPYTHILTLNPLLCLLQSSTWPGTAPPVRLHNYPLNEKQENAITQTGDNEIKLWRERERERGSTLYFSDQEYHLSCSNVPDEVVSGLWNGKKVRRLLKGLGVGNKTETCRLLDRFALFLSSVLTLFLFFFIMFSPIQNGHGCKEG